MNRLTPADLLSLEAYHRERPRLRAEVLAHKRNRQVGIGPSVTLYFEDRVTVRYQVQEMLRIERIFESEAIADELEAYNPLIPDGTNLKATMMLEYPDADERRVALAKLGGIEHAMYVQVGSLGRAFAHADEDLPRTEADKTAAVHFLRLELDASMRAALKDGARLLLGVDHAHYMYEIEAIAEVRAALVADLD